MNKIIYLIIGLGVVLGVSFFFNQNNQLGGDGGTDARACDVSSVTAVTVGDDLTTEVVGASSRRAWARIGVIDGEVEPIFVSFDEGADATVNNGVILTATGTTEVMFGLNTDFPYTGAVDAITGTASTSVSITTCDY